MSSDERKKDWSVNGQRWAEAVKAAIAERKLKRLAAHRVRYEKGEVSRPEPCKCTCGLRDDAVAQHVCEHTWDGPCVEDSFGGHGATCSGCGMAIISHLLRM